VTWPVFGEIGISQRLELSASLVENTTTCGSRSTIRNGRAGDQSGGGDLLSRARLDQVAALSPQDVPVEKLIVGVLLSRNRMRPPSETRSDSARSPTGAAVPWRTTV